MSSGYLLRPSHISAKTAANFFVFQGQLAMNCTGVMHSCATERVLEDDFYPAPVVVQRVEITATKRSFLSAFRMFVPSLSW